MQSILLNTPESFLKFSTRDYCAFFDLLVTNLAKSSMSNLEFLMIDYKEQGKWKKAVVQKQDFIEGIAFNKCSDIRERIKKFQISNIQSLLKTNKLYIPLEMDQCDSIYLKWINDPNAPYLCQIQQILKQGEKLELETKNLGKNNYQEIQENKKTLSLYRFLKNKVSEKIQQDLNHFCEFSHQKDYFCDYFFKVNYWDKIADEKSSQRLLQSICEPITKKTFSLASKRECLSFLKSDQTKCHFLDPKKQGLAPIVDCDLLSIALNNSSLQRLTHDCPRQSDHQAATNASRILRYLNPPKEEKWEGFCSTISSGTVYEFLEKNDLEDVWNSQLCYLNKIDAKEVCFPVFMGNYNNSKASLQNVVERILKQTHGFSSADKCQVITSENYNPHELKYKSGCFIVLNQQSCGLGNCQIKIIWDEREIKPFSSIKTLTLDYFPAQLTSEQRSLSYLITKVGGKTHKTISSLSMAINFLKQYPFALIHGIGCSEDLLPQFFKKKTLNSCRPLPFLIDGMIREGENVSFVMRTSLDDLMSPRIISWPAIYSSLKAYQVYQPLRQWTLYGIY